jgi:putative ABC transport system permease protein
MSVLAYVVPSVLRNPRRSAAYLIGTVIAVGLVSSVLFFVVASAHDLTQRTLAPVRVDMQAVLSDPRASTTAVQHSLLGRPQVAVAQRFALAGFDGAQVRSGNRIGQTSSGKIMAVDPGYFAAFGAPVLRSGRFAAGGVVISLDMGTNLGARVGDMLTLTFPRHAPPVRVPITGIASMTNTDVLFAPLDPLLRANPFNPPANVVIMNYHRFESALKPALLAHAPPAPTGSFVLRAQAPVFEQVQLRLKRALIPADPAQAKTYVSRLQRSLEVGSGSRVTIFNNLASALDQAQSDVLWAQVIVVFLAVPGVVLAMALAGYVTATVIEAQRRELALLRMRGVGPRQLLSLLGIGLLLVALAGVVIGIGAGWITARVAAGASTATGAGDPLVVRSLLLALAAGLILGVASTLWPLRGVIGAPIVESRRRVARGRAPLWARLYLDVACLIVALVIYEVTQANGGFQPVLNAEGNPTVSLSLFIFVAPLLFWIGAILLLVRVSRGLVGRSGRLLARGFGRGVVGWLAARTLQRHSGSLHQAMVLVAMAVTFSTALVTFVHTYDQQEHVDAELTLGSDVRVDVVNRSQSDAVARRLSVPGVAAITPFRSTVAYVGAEIQDIFGIDVPSFTRATRLADTFFVGSSAQDTLRRLQATTNGILVSQETFRDYSLRLGDSLLLRMFNALRHAYVPVRFRLVGVAREFATAPKDAFLVANLAYVQQATGGGGVDLFLVRTTGDPSALAGTLRARFAAGPLVHVDDLTNVQQQLSTSLTSLNLSGLTRIDYFYTLVMVVTALLVFALAVLLERGRDFAVLQLLGTSPGQIGRLLLAEIGYAVVAGCVFGLAVGLAFAALLVQILTAIFDPPPDAIVVPWSTLAGLLAIVLLCGLAACLLASQRLWRDNLAQTLRDT